MAAAQSGDAVPAVSLTVRPYMGGDGHGTHLICTHCSDCGFNTFPPTTVCPRCMSLAVEPLPLSPTGTLYSYTTIRHAKADTFGGYVDFPEKIRIFGHLGGFSPESPPQCDMAVRLVPAAPVEGAKTSAPVDFKFVAAETVTTEAAR